MKRLLFALLAILTGLAATGSPVLAAVETQSTASATSPMAWHADTAGQPVVTRAFSADLDPGARPSPVLWMVAPVGARGQSVYLKADRAHE